MNNVTRKVMEILSVITTFIIFLGILSVVFVLPIYTLSSNQPVIYSIIVLTAFILLTIFILVRNLLNRYKSLKSVLLTLQHFLIFQLLPTILLLSLVLVEALIFRMFFYFPMLLVIPIEILANIAFLFFAVFLNNKLKEIRAHKFHPKQEG